MICQKKKQVSKVCRVKLAIKYNCRYLIVPKSSNGDTNCQTIDIVLDQHAKQIDILKAYFAGLSIYSSKKYDKDNLNRIYTEKDVNKFLDMLKVNNWDINRINLSTISNERYYWGNKRRE